MYGLPSNGSTDGEDEKMSESDIEGHGDDLPGDRREETFTTQTM